MTTKNALAALVTQAPEDDEQPAHAHPVNGSSAGSKETATSSSSSSGICRCLRPKPRGQTPKELRSVVPAPDEARGPIVPARDSFSTSAGTSDSGDNGETVSSPSTTSAAQPQGTPSQNVTNV